MGKMGQYVLSITISAQSSQNGHIVAGLETYLFPLIPFPPSWSVFCILYPLLHHNGSSLSVGTHSKVHGECPRLSFRALVHIRAQSARITLNYVTLSFFLFSFFHCFAQGILQSFLYTADDTWGSLTSHIVARANINSTVFPQFTGRHGNYGLELCDQVPVLGGNPHPCVPFFTTGQPGPITIPQRFLPPGTRAPDPNALFVRQPFISFSFQFIEPCLGQSPSPSAQSDEVVSFLFGNRCYLPLPPLTFTQTSATWLLDSRARIGSQIRSDGLSNVIVTSSDGQMSVTLDPVCTYTLLYPAAR